MLDNFAAIGAKAPPVLVKVFASSLRGSGLAVKPEELAGASMVLGGLGAVIGLISGGPIIALILAGLGSAGPVFACKASGGFREAKVARQLEHAGLDLAQAVHEGKPLAEALRKLAEKSDSPLAEELMAILGEHALGLSLTEALERFATRVRTAETVQIVTVLVEHLATGKSPLDPYRLLNFQQPYEMPEVPHAPPPATFDEAVHRLLAATLDLLEPKQLWERRPPGGTARLLTERAREALPGLRLPEAFRMRETELLQALADDCEGRGPLERLLRCPTVLAIYIVSPTDVFAATLPPELVEPSTPSGGLETPEGYQRAKLRFRDPEHLRLCTRRALAPLGADVGPANPTVEGMLPDGWGIGAQLLEGGTLALLMQRAQ